MTQNKAKASSDGIDVLVKSLHLKVLPVLYFHSHARQ